jgi:hypothetical protein
MPFASHDDLLGRPSGPMLPMDEAGAGGRESETLVPDGTFVTFRSDPRKMGDLSARPNAFNTGRVKTLTPEHAERNFPREGGVRFDVEEERKKSYRTRGEAYKDIPYGDAKPVIGDPMWPTKQLFPYTPTVKRVNSIEHDIVPISSRTSKRDSLVVPVDGDDSSRGFSPTKDMKGDLGMGRSLGSDAFVYGEHTADTQSGVNEHDLLTLVDWDDEKSDWQLGALGTKKAVAVASKIAAHLSAAALALAKKGHFKTVKQAVAWIEKRADEIKTRRIKRLDAAITHAIAVATTHVSQYLRNPRALDGLSDYLGQDEDDALGAFRWDGDSKSFVWRHLGSFHWDKDNRSFRWLEGITTATAVPVTSKTSMVGVPVGSKGTRLSGIRDTATVPISMKTGVVGVPVGKGTRLGGGEYADGEDTSGWGSESNDTFAYIPHLGAVSDEEKVTQDQVAASAANAVASQVKGGAISTTDQILGAINSAAKIAAQVYQQRVAPTAPKPGIASQIATTMLAPDQPLWKRPLFWIGAALLVSGVGFVALKGGGGKSGGRRTTRRYRKNSVLPFTAYSNRWKGRKSRWA